MKKCDVIEGQRYDTSRFGLVEALESNRAKVFCRVIETGRVELVSARSLRAAPIEEPQLVTESVTDWFPTAQPALSFGRWMLDLAIQEGRSWFRQRAGMALVGGTT